jgi:hypothetical protein
MSAYDPKKMEQYSELLSKRSKRITPVFALMGAIVGGGLGMALSRMLGSHSSMPVILWTVLLGVFGYVAGKERAFTLGLKSQELLLQRQIEENTRQAHAAAAK